MVFFQLNVTGLLFQSFRTASPRSVGWRKENFAPSVYVVSSQIFPPSSSIICRQI